MLVRGVSLYLTESTLDWCVDVGSIPTGSTTSSWWNGRHSWLKPNRFTACRFESDRGHHLLGGRCNRVHATLARSSSEFEPRTVHHRFGHVVQLGEYFAGSEEVTGSIPVVSTISLEGIRLDEEPDSKSGKALRCFRGSSPRPSSIGS